MSSQTLRHRAPTRRKRTKERSNEESEYRIRTTPFLKAGLPETPTSTEGKALDKELNSSISQSRAFLFEGFAAKTGFCPSEVPSLCCPIR